MLLPCQIIYTYMCAFKMRMKARELTEPEIRWLLVDNILKSAATNSA